MQAWAEKEDDFLIRNWDVISSNEIAEKLGRTRSSVINRRNRLSRQGMLKVKKGNREDRKLDFLVSLLIVKNRNIKHENAVVGCMEAVRAGELEDIKIKVV